MKFDSVNLNEHVYVKPTDAFLQEYKKDQRRHRRWAIKRGMERVKAHDLYPDNPKLTPEGYYKAQLWTCLHRLTHITHVGLPTPIVGLQLYFESGDVKKDVDLPT